MYLFNTLAAIISLVSLGPRSYMRAFALHGVASEPDNSPTYFQSQLGIGPIKALPQ